MVGGRPQGWRVNPACLPGLVIGTKRKSASILRISQLLRRSSKIHFAGFRTAPFRAICGDGEEVKVVYDLWPSIDKTTLPPRYIDLARDSYDDCVSYLDEQLGLLFDAPSVTACLIGRWSW